METKERKLERENVVLDVIPVTTHPTKTTRVLNRGVAIALVVITLALGVILKWSFESTDTLVVNNSPFPARVVPDTTGKTGGTVFLTVDACKNTEISGEVRVSYLSASREQFTPIVKEHLPKGCFISEVPVVIPTNLSEDVYKIRFRVIYDVNPLKQNIPVEFESQPVNIGASKL